MKKNYDNQGDEEENEGRERKILYLVSAYSSRVFFNKFDVYFVDGTEVIFL